MPLLRAVFMMAFPVHGGDINSTLLIWVNGREGADRGGGAWNHLEEVEGLSVTNWKSNWK